VVSGGGKKRRMKLEEIEGLKGEDFFQRKIFAGKTWDGGQVTGDGGGPSFRACPPLSEGVVEHSRNVAIHYFDY
jgi:hypothetical protein